MSADPIHTLADLDTWSFSGTALAVLGHPIKHSLSPQMHNAALAEMTKHDARFASWKYFRFDIAPDDLPIALEKFSNHQFKGLNLTVPHKVLAFDLVNTSGTDAHEIGAVNTLTLESNLWFGGNTDGYGLETGILENFRTSIADRDIILLGAGGAARGAAVMCLHRHCRSLWIANRTAKNRDQLREHLLGASWHLKVPVFGFDPSAPPKELPPGALVINATSAGLKPTDPLPIDLSALPRPAGVYDMIYNPPMTGLLEQASQLGIPYSNGLSMLVHQGARALEIWSDAPVPVDAMRAAVHSAMKAHS